MEQKITDMIRLTKCYNINEQFLAALDNIIYTHDQNARMKIKITCGGITYSFEDSASFIDFTTTMTEIIGELQIKISFLRKIESFWSNEIVFSFYNDPESLPLHPGQVTFDFDNKKDFLVLKNEIETMMKNYEKNTIYSFLSTVPFVAYLSIAIAVGVIAFGGSRGWDIYSLILSTIMLELALILELSFGKMPKKIKRYVFPFVEFEFGNNKGRNEKGRTIRRIIYECIIIGFCITLVGGYILEKIFA